MVNKRLHRTRRVLFALAPICVLWAAAIDLTGGFRLQVAGWRLSSRDPWVAGEIAVLLELAALAMTPWAGGLSGLRDEWQWWSARARPLWRRYGLILPALLVVLVAGAFEIHRWLGAEPFWLDEETISLNVRDRSVAGLAGALWLGQSAPLGWLILVHGVVRVLGTSEIALRLVPLIFGLAMLAAALWVARRWMDLIGALTLTWLCAFSHWLSHYAFEVKHYTADACWSLALPALAVWAIEADTTAARRQRVVWWWALAALGLWLANGATLATPAVAVLLVVAMWRVSGRRAAVFTAVVGLVWLASFAVHYELSGRYTLASPYLQAFWAPDMPPASSGVLERVQWTLRRLQPLALNPAGTDWWVSLWACAVAGFALSRRRWLGLAFGSTPLSALVFGALGLVPLSQRLALWSVPALYVGVALLMDRAARGVRDAIQSRRWVLGGLAAGVLVVGIRMDVNVFDHGTDEVLFPGALTTKQALDDRSGVEWLMRRRQAGDVVITTHMAWPAVWWYGDLPLGDPLVAQGTLADGTTLDEIDYRTPGPDCGPNELREALHGRRRVLVYLGFHDVPDGYNEFLVGRLSELGEVTAMRYFAGYSFGAVVDLASAKPIAAPDRPAIPAAGGRGLDGCIGVQPARRW
jgi:hypothetical protein